MSIIEKTFIGDRCISTIRLPVEHYGGMWYETMVFAADGEKITSFDDLLCKRYATEEEARAGHAEVCEQLEAEYGEVGSSGSTT